MGKDVTYCPLTVHLVRCYGVCTGCYPPVTKEEDTAEATDTPTE